MCICLIQFQHNSYPCNTPRTLAYGYMRYKLEVWLKITGVSISIIFHKIVSREKKLHKQDHNPLQDESGEESSQTRAHTPMQIWPGTKSPRWTPNAAGFLLVGSQHCLIWLEARIQSFLEAICDGWTKEQSSLLEIWIQNSDQVMRITVWPWAI